MKQTKTQQEAPSTTADPKEIRVKLLYLGFHAHVPDKKTWRHEYAVVTTAPNNGEPLGLDRTTVSFADPLTKDTPVGAIVEYRANETPHGLSVIFSGSDTAIWVGYWKNEDDRRTFIANDDACRQFVKALKSLKTESETPFKDAIHTLRRAYEHTSPPHRRQFIARVVHLICS